MLILHKYIFIFFKISVTYSKLFHAHDKYFITNKERNMCD